MNLLQIILDSLRKPKNVPTQCLPSNQTTPVPQVSVDQTPVATTPVVPEPKPLPPLIDRQKFAKFAPNAVPNTIEALEAAAHKHGLTDPEVMSDWLGQMHVESAGFSVLKENLNYSVEGLIKGFGRHRISIEDAHKYGRKKDQKADQKAIANILYGGAWGEKNLGNIHPNDGWDFRGAGFKQLTGRHNHEKYGVTAEQLQDPFVSADVAARFFVDVGGIELAKNDQVTLLTQRINGGSKGLELRKAKTRQAREVLL